MRVSEALVLGIESTCDETGAALVRGRELLGDVVATSMDAYARFGGIIPEIASRAHLESFLPTLDAALDRAGVDLDDVDVIAVSAGPGLVGSLTVGISAAKALSACLGRPIYGVNHVIGHLAVDELVDGPLPERFIGLIVSGGHSSLLHVKDVAADVVELGGTLDDAAGEAFDKVGRLLGLPYPGGPHVDRLSQEVKDSPEAGIPDRHGDGPAAVPRLHAPHEAIGRTHGNTAHHIVPDLLSDLSDELPAVVADLNRVEKRRQLPFLEADIEHSAHNLYYLAYMLLTHVSLSLFPPYHCPSAPATISVISWVIDA